MNLSLLPQSYFPRRSNSFRSTSSPPDAISSAADSLPTTPKPPPANPFWLLLHCLCCLVSLILGFRFSRVVFFLLFSTAATTTTTLYTTTTTTLTTITTTTTALTLPLLPTTTAAPNRTHSRVTVGRHGIRIRPWPHPNAAETMRAHRIIERVQTEQRTQYGIKKPRPLLVVTPTYVRAFQALHLTALMHSLMLVPYDLTWVVVEAGGVSNETASILDRSQLNYIHVPFHEGEMPWERAERHKVEARMRLHALRMVRERRMDGIVMFADDSNIHSMELFDEIQKVKWMGAVSVGILTHSEISEHNEGDLLVPIQGPDCSSSGKLSGWNTFNSSPMKLEWAGFALNARLLWEDAEGKPDWVRNLDDVGMNGEEVESPLSLVKDASSVEPLGKCGNKVLLWWLRAEARADSKFPAGWIIDHSLDVPAKHTPWQTRY